MKSHQILHGARRAKDETHPKGRGSVATAMMDTHEVLSLLILLPFLPFGSLQFIVFLLKLSQGLLYTSPSPFKSPVSTLPLS